MEASAVVVVVDVVTDGGHRLTASSPDDMIQIGFERVEKAFDDGVVVAIATATHTAADPVHRELPLIGGAGVLPAAIGMVLSRGTAPHRERAAPRGQHERRLEMGIDRPADDAPRVEIEQDREIQPALARGQGGDVAGPDGIRARDREALGQDIGSRRGARIPLRGAPKPPPRTASQLRLAHEADDAIATHGKAASPQLSL